MAFLKSEDHFSVSAIRLFVKPLLVIVLGAGSFVVARLQDSQSNKGDESGRPRRNPMSKTRIRCGRRRATIIGALQLLWSFDEGQPPTSQSSSTSRQRQRGAVRSGFVWSD
jgi:hypothetical protein